MLFSFWFDKFKLSNGTVALLLLPFASIPPRSVTLPREIRSFLCADERDFFHDVPFANGARLTARRTNITTLRENEQQRCRKLASCRHRGAALNCPEFCGIFIFNGDDSA